jgi:DNA-binding CsgD family transcriptional regulator/PAS domain-containing protein
VGASIEAVDRLTMRHKSFFVHGLPPKDQLDYFAHYAALNPRWSLITRQKTGELGWDYRILDEDEMRCSPFYAEFLRKIDFPYFVYGMLTATREEFAGLAVHRSAKQGHVDRQGISRLRVLVPHIRQAFDVTRRLNSAARREATLQRTLDWLADGVALLLPDGSVVHANDAFRSIVGNDDGIGLSRSITFAMPAARDRFQSALASVLRVRAGDPSPCDVVDFPVRRRSGAPSYIVSLRLLAKGDHAEQAGGAAVVVFVHDPQSRVGAGPDMLREAFNLTEAEASVARAIQAEQLLTQYAREHTVSINTVYTHLRRIKEKTGCARMTQLIRKLNDLQTQLRPE